MYNFLCILLGKFIIFLGYLLKRGSSLPGLIILKINKNILSSFKLPKTVIAITGSSGKGSCSKIIANIFKDQGYSVAHNSAGSNLSAGITTLLLKYCNLKGKIKSDILIYEVDERYTKYIFKDIKPNIVVITNITRDQPPRQGHFDLVYEEINKAITKDMTLILNGDDPYLRKFKTNKIYYYGISKNKYSYLKNKFENLNINYCPKCNSKLKYNYYHFESNGDYYCPNCSFKRPIIDYLITNINYDKNIITVNNKYKMNIPNNLLYSIYNILTCFSVAQICKLDTSKTTKTISSINSNQKIFKSFNYNNRLVSILNNKNENSTTFNQSIWYLNRQKGPMAIIIGWKEISRRYNFDDLSWLYDINFELIKKMNTDKIICTGIHCYDIAVRLKLAGISKDKIITYDNLEKATMYLKNKTKGNIYAILNFDYILPFCHYMNGSDNK